MAFVAETEVGATAGAVPPARGYSKRVREICDGYGVLLILDEVICGMGRTGTLHACEQERIAPDSMTIAKGLGGGYEPIGAVPLGEHIFKAFAEGSGFFQHGQRGDHVLLAPPFIVTAGRSTRSSIALAARWTTRCHRRASLQFPTGEDTDPPRMELS